MERGTSLIKFTFLLAVTAAALEKGSTDRLAGEADAIVVGEIQSGQQIGNVLSFVLSVTRTIKGDLAAGATANVSGSVRLRLNRSLRGQHGLWFLKKTSSQWVLLPIMPGGAALEASCYFQIPKGSSPPTVRTPSPPVTISDRIAVELVAAIESYTDPGQLFNLAYGLSGILESGIVADLYRILRGNPDPEIKFIGLARSPSPQGNPSFIPEVAGNLDLIPKLHTAGMIVASICGIRNADARVIQHLGKIALSSNTGLQGCAAKALAYVHTRDTLPFLVQLLESSEATVREDAMMGLSRFVENLPPQTAYTLDGRDLIPQGPALYRTPETDRHSLSVRRLGQADQTEYVQFWKSWWATMKDKVMAAP